MTQKIDADLTLMVDTQKLKIGRVDMPDGNDKAYVVAMDNPAAEQFSAISEYVPSWATLNDVQSTGGVIVLTFVDAGR